MFIDPFRCVACELLGAEVMLMFFAMRQITVWIIASRGIKVLGGKLVINAGNSGVGCCVLMWVFYEYSCLQCSAAAAPPAPPVTGRQISALLSTDTDSQSDILTFIK